MFMVDSSFGLWASDLVRHTNEKTQSDGAEENLDAGSKQVSWEQLRNTFNILACVPEEKFRRR
jgi:hypothetical protein